MIITDQTILTYLTQLSEKELQVIRLYVNDEIEKRKKVKPRYEIINLKHEDMSYDSFDTMEECEDGIELQKDCIRSTGIEFEYLFAIKDHRTGRILPYISK